MTQRSGINSSIGLAEEVTYGVPVAPSRWFPVKEFSFEADPERIDSEAIVAGARLQRSSQWSLGKVMAGGDMGFEVYDRSIGLLFKHMFGGVNTTGPVSSLYTHTFTPGDLEGKSLSIQAGIPDVDTGTVNPFTYSGCKIQEWELACSEGELATLGLTIAAKNAIIHRTVADGVTTNTSTTITSATAAFNQDDYGKPIAGTGIPAGATIASVQSATSATLSAAATATGSALTFTFGLALSSPSYTANQAPMSFTGATVTVAGAAYRAKSFTLSANNQLVDRFFLGEQGRFEPIEAGIREITGEISAEFNNMAAYRRFVAGQEAAVVFGLQRGTSTITVTMNVRFDGSTPSVSGPEIVGQDLPFKVLGTTTDAGGITAVLVNLDATP